MGISHLGLHALERRIAEVILKGFSPKMDRGDAIQAGLDIAEMLVREYVLEDREELLEDMGKRRATMVPLKSLAESVADLRKTLAEPKNGIELAISPVHAAGFGGGMGDER